jgi:hypothetical protein
MFFVLSHHSGVFVSYDHMFFEEVTGRVKKSCKGCRSSVGAYRIRPCTAVTPLARAYAIRPYVKYT